MNTEPVSILSTDILHAIDLYLDEFYPEAIAASNELAAAGLLNKDIHAFASVISTAARFSQVINFIKNQAGKDVTHKWTRVAPFLLDQLDLLEAKAIHLGNEKAAVTLEIKMKLAKGWAKQVITHFLYKTSIKKEVQ